MMSSSDETYLEAFIEKLTTLPHQLRRNLDLLKDLDGCSSDDLHKLRKLQREYILAAEEKMMQLEVVEMEPADDVDDNEDSEMDDEPKTKKCPVYGVRVLNEDGTSSPDNPVVVPTTEEFMEYITYNTANNANAAASYQQIRKLQHDCLQKADEKVAVAQQAYEMMDAQVQRLDADLAAMEQLLQATGEFQTGPTAKPNDLAACQVTPGSEWILAKVIHHDPATGMYKLSDEDVESNKIFDLPEQQVIVLSGIERLTKGDAVFAVYPDTTSFYQATVVQAPRKQGVSGQFVMVNFVDDSDEFGITHDKAVPIQYIMAPPPATP